jgi:hypothetical protein
MQYSSSLLLITIINNCCPSIATGNYAIRRETSIRESFGKEKKSLILNDQTQQIFTMMSFYQIVIVLSMMTCERTYGFTFFGTVSRSVNRPLRVMTTAFRRSQLSMAADIISPFDAASTSTLDDLVRQQISIPV